MPDPSGLVAVQVLELLQETFVAELAPNLIEVDVVLKFVPVIVTTLPPVIGPELGEMPVTVGGA